MSHEPSGWRQASGPAGMSPIWPASTLTRSVGVMQPTTLPYSSRTKARGVGSSRKVSSISVSEACSKIVGAGRSRGRTLQTRSQGERLSLAKRQAVA